MKTNRIGKTTRKWEDENTIVQELQKLEGVQLNIVDLADLLWDEQIKLMAPTDILVGFHGAGLSQQLFLPDNSDVFEISSSHYISRVHFVLMSLWLGHEYHFYTHCRLVGSLEDVIFEDIEHFRQSIQSVADSARIKKCKKFGNLDAEKTN